LSAAWDYLLTRTESPDGLLIRARQVFNKVAADPDRFRPVAAALVAEARRAGQPEALAAALRALAWAERLRLNAPLAIRLLDEACRIARRHRLADVLADVLMSRAAVRQELGHMLAARRDLRDAATLVTGARTRELNFQQATLLQNAGQLADAAAIYQRLLSDPGADPSQKTKSASNLALIESEQGRYAQALRRCDQALQAAIEIGPALAAAVAESRAWVTVQSGRFAEGMSLFDQATQALSAARLPLGDHYHEYADALMELRLLPEAAAAARRGMQEFTAAGVPLMAAEAQLRVAQLALLAGDTAEAITASTTATTAFRQQRRWSWRARSLLVTAEARLNSGTATPADLTEAQAAARRMESLGMNSAAVQGFLVTGRLAASLGRPRQAVTALAKAGSLARGAPILVRVRGRHAAALAARLRHRDREALAHCRHGLTDLARHRGGLPSAELRALASGHGAELGLIGLDVVVRDGSPGRVLNWMERSRAAALLAVEPPGFNEIRADLAALRVAHGGRAASTGSASTGSASTGSASTGGAGQQRAAGPDASEQTAIEDRIRHTTWRAASVARAPTALVTVGELRGQLQERVLVEYGLLGQDLVAVVIDARGSRLSALGPLAPVRDQLRALHFALRRLAKPGQQAQHAAARASADLRIRSLTELLIDPLRVPADLELVVVPVPDLQGVPWAALHGGPVGLAPSATFWTRTALAAQHQRQAGDSDRTVVLMAGPDLPGAVAEVESLAQIHPSAICLTPPASTAEAVAAALDGAELAHLACHGTLRADNPMFSSLLLSDGPLTLQELYARGLAPHRLVLAACRSGSQASYAGDEVLGFVTALLARGTAGILASTADVPDVEAVELMTAVHEQLAKGATLAHALHAARASQDTGNPGDFVNWCTFNVHGAA
jgi:tetratricopeptide (TPR) repeat protein